MEPTLAERQLGSWSFLNSLSIYLTAQHVGILNYTHFEHPGVILWCLGSYVGNTTHQYNQVNELRSLLASVCSLQGPVTSPAHPPTDRWGAESEAGVKPWLTGGQGPSSLPPRARLCQSSLSLSSAPAGGEGWGEHSLHLCVRNHNAVIFSFHLELVPFSWVMAICFQIICLSN